MGLSLADLTRPVDDYLRRTRNGGAISPIARVSGLVPCTSESLIRRCEDGIAAGEVTQDGCYLPLVSAETSPGRINVIGGAVAHHFYTSDFPILDKEGFRYQNA